MTDNRDNILNALATFAAKRPGLDPRDYISSWDDRDGRRAYFSESRSITRDLHHARALLSAVRRTSIGEDTLRKAFQIYGGRLSWDGKTLYYCTGQYYPTEYRRAVCAVLSGALWAHYRDGCNCDTSDKIRAAARRELPRAIAARWFN